MNIFITRQIPAALCALFLMATGCIDSTLSVNVNKDGSGTITQEMVISTAAFAMMNNAGGGADAALDIGEASARAAAPNLGEGVTYVSRKDITRPDGAKGSLVTYAFEDINKVRVGGVIEGASGPVKATADDEEKIHFSFKGGNNPSLTVHIPQQDKDEGAPEAAAKAPQNPNDPMMAMMMQMMKDLRMRMLLTVEGGPKKTNASFQGEDGTITLMDMGLGKIMADPAKMSKLQALGQGQDPMAAAKALNEFEEVKFETKKEVNVSF